MKKSLLILALALSLFSFKKNVLNEYLISGTIDGVENGTSILLEKQDDTKGIITVDSTKVQDGKFTFKGTTLEPSIHFLEVKNTTGKVVFIVEEGKIDLLVYKDSITKSKIGGTKNNDYLRDFSLTTQKVQKKMLAFQSLNMQKITDAQEKHDTLVINNLMKEYGKFQEEMNVLTAKYPEENPKSFISVLILESSLNNPNTNINDLKKTFLKLDASIKNTKPGKSIESKIANFKSVGINDMAPDFSAPNPNGKIISLKKSLGKVIIIDFWASWCGPCRRENPNVVALYNELHSKGLNIVGVSLDKTVEDWQKAITKDGITWTQVSNLKFWDDPIAKLYKVEQIPTTFILDASGRIVAKDLRGADLKAKVLELLGK
ncbi:redoxin domain-containing protein [Flavobacterium sp.]|uniref:redoxin domain-containing protein n=1 Tax=Flavobacterium sp. TaxID=239 RepID=UPI003750EC54